MIGKVSFRQN